MIYDEKYFEIRDKNIDKTEWFDILKYLLGCRKVLEVGCGTGQLLLFLQEKGFEVYGCDISSYAVEKARERGLEVIQCDAHKLPYRDEEFDCVISQHLLEHCEDDTKVLLETWRVAKYRVIHIVPGHPNNDPTHVRNYYTLDMVNELINRFINILALRNWFGVDRVKSRIIRITPDSMSFRDIKVLDWIIIIDKK